MRCVEERQGHCLLGPGFLWHLRGLSCPCSQLVQAVCPQGLIGYSGTGTGFCSRDVGQECLHLASRSPPPPPYLCSFTTESLTAALLKVSLSPLQPSFSLGRTLPSLSAGLWRSPLTSLSAFSRDYILPRAVVCLVQCYFLLLSFLLTPPVQPLPSSPNGDMFFLQDTLILGGHKCGGWSTTRGSLLS